MFIENIIIMNFKKINNTSSIKIQVNFVLVT